MFAVIHIPQFALQAALRHEPALWPKPVALIDPSARPPVVLETTEAARAAGVSPGLTPTQAMARCAHVLIRPRSLRQEDAATAALLQTAYGFSPHLEATAPGVCTLDLRGLAAVADADQAALEKWAGKVQHALARVQLAAAIGLGPTPQVARHAAQWSKGIAVVQEPDAFIAGLPVAALNPSPDVARLLKRWGIGTVSELLALGQDALSARLGLEALALFAAASSAALRPLTLAHPTERFEESFEFDPPVETVEPLLFLLRRFVDQLGARLDPRGFAAESLLLELGLESGEKLSARLRLPQPTRQPDVLFRTLQTHLENVRTDAAVTAVALKVLPTQAEQKQLGLFETILSDPQQFQETLARLSAVLGPDRVGTPALENSHRPDSFRLAAPDFENAPTPEANRRPVLQQGAPPIRRFRPALKAEVECEGPAEPAAPTPPAAPANPKEALFLNAKEEYRAPVIAPADVTAAAKGRAAAPKSLRPISIRCAVSNGKLKLTIGPWRASGQWWDPNAWEREEWDATTSDGQVIRLVHEPDGWFVEGVMD